MRKIYSKVNPDKLLHVVFREDDIREGRTDILDPNQFLQCSALCLHSGKTFKPHKHIRHERSYDDYIPQESWVVLSGRVNACFYDIDDTLIERVLLESGDASFTLEGGHTYEILDDFTCVYEFKTGPYYGRENDKVFINE